MAPGLALVPKLKYEHVYLTSFSRMRVDLAAQVSGDAVVVVLYFLSLVQVLSGTVANALKLTACFVGYFDKFFDSTNVSCFTVGQRSRDPFKSPYHSASDFRLKVSIVLFMLLHYNPCCSGFETSSSIP